MTVRRESEAERLSRQLWTLAALVVVVGLLAALWRPLAVGLVVVLFAVWVARVFYRTATRPNRPRR